MVALTRAVILGGRAIRKTQGRAFYGKHPEPAREEAANHVVQNLKGVILFKVHTDGSIKVLFTRSQVPLQTGKFSLIFLSVLTI